MAASRWLATMFLALIGPRQTAEAIDVARRLRTSARATMGLRARIEAFHSGSPPLPLRGTLHSWKTDAGTATAREFVLVDRYERSTGRGNRDRAPMPDSQSAPSLLDVSAAQRREFPTELKGAGELPFGSPNGENGSKWPVAHGPGFVSPLGRRLEQRLSHTCHWRRLDARSLDSTGGISHEDIKSSRGTPIRWAPALSGKSFIVSGSGVVRG